MLVVPIQSPEFVTRKKRSSDVSVNQRDVFMAVVSPEVEISAAPRLRLVANRKRRDVDGAEVELSQKFQRKFVKRYAEDSPHIRRKRETFEISSWARMQDIRRRFYDIKADTCGGYESTDLFLPGDAGYGVETQFEPQGRTALRLAHFLSNFLQNVDEYEQYGNLKGDRRLNETHIFGEVLAMVMGDFKVSSAGAYFDQYKFRVAPPVNTTDPRYSNTLTREYFGPFAYRVQNKRDGLDAYRAIDTAGNTKRYDDELWFRRMQQRWATNFHSLKKYIDKPMIRSSPNSTSSIRFEHYPITYRAPSYEDGEWLRPEFKCDGMVDDWVATYVVPFFGLNSVKTQVEFK